MDDQQVILLAVRRGLLSPERLDLARAECEDAPLLAWLGQRGWLTADQERELRELLAQSTVRELNPVSVPTPVTDLDRSLNALCAVEATCRGRFVLDGDEPRGKGGMGRVWLAHDDQLGRVVALKEMLPNLLDHEEARRRFLLEAQVTSQLQHPGIVPVYEMATADDGSGPFYTMRFVEGRSLSEAIGAFHANRERLGRPDPVELRDLLGAFITVCNTLAYAHSRGVIHRDLKPDNVRLGAFGEVVVLDWGLALVRGQSTHQEALPVSVDDPVLSRAAGGTPAYMAPEQTTGSNSLIEPHTDVFALGGILYAILAGRAPYSGKNIPELLEQIRQGKVDPVRSQARWLPPGLAAICTKALQARPEDRYPSATELAEEVRRFLADEPVKAWPEPVWRRAGRWIKRHRTLAVGLASCFLVAMLALAWDAQQSRKREKAVSDARDVAVAEGIRADGNAIKATIQAQRADENYRKASEKLRAMVFRTVDKRWDGLPQMTELRQGLVGDAMAYFERVAQQNGDDPAVRTDIAWASYGAGFLRGALGDSKNAVRNFQRGAELTRGLIREGNGTQEHRLLLTDCLNGLGNYTQDQKLADACFRDAVDILDPMLASDPENIAILRGMAAVLTTWGAAQVSAGQFASAEQHLLRAVSLFDRLVRLAPQDGYEVSRGRARLNLCGALRQQGRPLGSHHDKAEADFAFAQKKNPSDSSLIDGLAVLRINRADDNLNLLQRFALVNALSNSVTMLEEARRLSPTVPGYTDLLYRTHATRARVLQSLFRYEEALRDWDRAIALSPPQERMSLMDGLDKLILQAGDSRRLVEEADRLLLDNLLKGRAAHRATLRRWYSRAAEMARTDPRLNPTQRQQLQERCRMALAALPTIEALAQFPWRLP